MLADYLTLLDRLVPASSGGDITHDDRTAAIGQGVTRYGQDRPRTAVEDVAVTGTVTSLPLPGGWEDGFSVITGLEYPIGQVPPAPVDNDRWSLYQAPNGQVILLLDAVSAAVRVTFTQAHQVTDAVDTIPLMHREAVAKLAAAILCDELANFFASDTDPTIGADRAQGQTRSQAFAARAREMRKQYQDAVGVAEKAAAPASKTVQLRSTDSTGQPRLFHPRRFTH